MRALCLTKLISILAAVPPTTLVPALKNPRLDADLARIIFDPWDETFVEAHEALSAAQYLPCRLQNSRDLREHLLYSQPADISRAAVPVVSSDLRSPDGELVVREFDDGKYTVVWHPPVTFTVLRHDTAWREFTGDKFVNCLMIALLEK